MLHVVDFRTSAGDTGEPNSDSIVPYNNGESADQTVLRRPPEHNRLRTESLRQLVREHIMLKDYNDQGSALVGGGTLTVAVGGSGLLLAISSNMYIVPFSTPGGGVSAPYVASTEATLSVGTGVNELVFTSVQKQFEGATFPEADANKISVEILDGGVGSPLTVTVEGAAGELNNIKIVIDASVHTLNQVISAVAGHATAPNLVVASLGSSAVGTNLCPLFGPPEWGSDFSQRFLRGGAPGLAHEITKAGLELFFVDPNNELQLGDTLAVYYDKLLNTTTTGGRLQSTPENTNINVDAALFNTRREPEKIPNSIPICKRLSGNELLFINGATIVQGTPATLQVDSVTLLGAEQGLLATPLNWDRMDSGPDHNPPTSIREALDNADGHIDNILDEVEAARTSDLYGAFGALDDRLEAGDADAALIVTVTDGTLTTGGQYNGVTALQDAITDLGITGNGGVIVVKRGNYTITSALNLSAPVSIIAPDEDVDVDISAVAAPSYALTLQGASRYGVISGLRFQGSASYAIDMQGRSWVVERSQFATARGVQLYGVGCAVRNCQFLTTSQCVSFHSNAVACSLHNCRLEHTDPALPALNYDGQGAGNTITSCFINLENGNDLEAFKSGSSSYGLAITGMHILASPHTAAKDTFYIDGQGITVDGLSIAMSGAFSSNVLGTLVRVQPTGGPLPITLRNVSIDCDGYQLQYAADDNPVKLVGANVVVDGLTFQNFTLRDGGLATVDEPVIAIAGCILRNLIVNDIKTPGGAAGTLNVTLVGARLAWATAGGPAFEIDRAYIITNGLTYGTGTAYVIGNLMPYSIVHHCDIRGDGQFDVAINTTAPGSKILNNTIIRDPASGAWTAINVGWYSAFYDGDESIVSGNFVQQDLGTSIAIGNAAPVPTDTVDRVGVFNNTVLDGAPATGSIWLYAAAKPIVMGNNVTGGILVAGSVTGIKPDGVTIGVTDVNVLA